jgi:seryl-tRNA synthetase
LTDKGPGDTLISQFYSLNNIKGKKTLLDKRFIRENFEFVKKKVEQRGIDVDLDTFTQNDEERRDFLRKIEELRHKKNVVSEKIGVMIKNKEDASGLIKEMKGVSEDIKQLEESIRIVEEDLDIISLSIPNIPHDSVPLGADETYNKLIKTWGEPRKFPFNPKPHWEIGEDLDIIDFERASKIAGSRFVLLKGKGALLERALIAFMLDLHIKEHGYTEVLPPILVNTESLFGTGQLPKFEDDLFRIKNGDYYLIPTAEVPVTNIHRQEILDGGSLPIRYVSFTPCFRSEAGSYGKDTRGLIRQHQFDKVELVKFARPENSYEELETLLLDAEEVLKRLKIPYRIVSLCTGDLGFSSAKTYDIEVWVPSQDLYREISSCSNFEDFQARRAKIRFRDKPSGKTELIHTLNGSGLAVGRTMVAVLENYQEENGDVIIPEVLRPYMDGIEKISRV